MAVVLRSPSVGTSAHRTLLEAAYGLEIGSVASPPKTAQGRPGQASNGIPVNR